MIRQPRMCGEHTWSAENVGDESGAANQAEDLTEEGDTDTKTGTAGSCEEALHPPLVCLPLPLRLCLLPARHHSGATERSSSGRHTGPAQGVAAYRARSAFKRRSCSAFARASAALRATSAFCRRASSSSRCFSNASCTTHVP